MMAFNFFESFSRFFFCYQIFSVFCWRFQLFSCFWFFCFFSVYFLWKLFIFRVLQTFKDHWQWEINYHTFLFYFNDSFCWCDILILSKNCEIRNCWKYQKKVKIKAYNPSIKCSCSSMWNSNSVKLLKHSKFKWSRKYESFWLLNCNRNISVYPLVFFLRDRIKKCWMKCSDARILAKNPLNCFYRCVFSKSAIKSGILYIDENHWKWHNEYWAFLLSGTFAFFWTLYETERVKKLFNLKFQRFF